MTKLKLKSDISKSSNKCFDNFFDSFFRVYIKMSKNLSVKYHQESKERLQRKLVKDIKIFLKEKKKKSDNMAVNITKISKKM